MASSNFFKVKKGINLPVYTDTSDLTTNGFSDSTGEKGDMAFAGDVAYYKDHEFGKVTPVGSIIEYTDIGGTAVNLTSSYYCMRVSPGSTMTFILPAPSSVPTGKMYIIKDNGTGTAVIDAGTNSSTLDGLTSYTCGEAESVTVVSDGTVWHIL